MVEEQEEVMLMHLQHHQILMEVLEEEVELLLRLVCVLQVQEIVHQQVLHKVITVDLLVPLHKILLWQEEAVVVQEQ
jgi:hypothetical protein